MNVFLMVTAGLLFVGSVVFVIWGMIIHKRGVQKELVKASREIESVHSGSLITLMLMYRISTNSIPEADRKFKIAGWLFVTALLPITILFFRLTIF